MTSSSASVLTLVRGRRAHLVNLIAGLNASTRKPDELGDRVHAGRAARRSAADRLSGARGVRRGRRDAAGGGAQPCGGGCEWGSADLPGCRLRSFADVGRALRGYGDQAGRYSVGRGAVSPPRPARSMPGWTGTMLDRVGLRHPAKPPIALDDIRPTPSHGELWGLSFAISAADWARAGGMDERYVGYGGEETDFAARLEHAGVPMWWVGGARAYHQHHVVHTPAYQHFDAIIRNARLFRGDLGAVVHGLLAGAFRRARVDRLGCGNDYGVARSDCGRGGRVEGCRRRFCLAETLRNVSILPLAGEDRLAL